MLYSTKKTYFLVILQCLNAPYALAHHHSPKEIPSNTHYVLHLECVALVYLKLYSDGKNFSQKHVHFCLKMSTALKRSRGVFCPVNVNSADGDKCWKFTGNVIPLDVGFFLLYHYHYLVTHFIV